MRKELKDNDYDTDKRVHPHYLQNFQEHLGHLADQPITLLELGVYHGGSLLMWRDYFVAGRIVGIDINPVSLADETGRVEVYRGRQQDTEFLEREFTSQIHHEARAGTDGRISSPAPHDCLPPTHSTTSRILVHAPDLFREYAQVPPRAWVRNNRS